MYLNLDPAVATAIGICFVFACGMLALVQVARINKEQR